MVVFLDLDIILTKTGLLSHSKFFHLSSLAFIVVDGEDSAKFLQGQLTSDIRSLLEYQAAIAGFCNAKGRVISTLLVVKTDKAFILILPASLVEKVYQKLQMYILRSKVALSRQKKHMHLLGLENSVNGITEIDRDWSELLLQNDDFAVVTLPYTLERSLCIVDTAKASLPDRLLETLDQPDHDQEWLYLDVLSGFPWFDEPQSESYTPQMLSLDVLGGVSFNKGCYTGQEVVARTHFLGKAKRHLFQAECLDANDLPAAGVKILDGSTFQVMGEILMAKTFRKTTRFLLVLQDTVADTVKLVLDDHYRTAIKIV